MSTRHTTVCLGTLAAAVAMVLLAGCQKQQTATTPPPPPAHTLPLYGPGEVALTRCTSPTGHGGGYKEVTCPEACKTTVTDHKWNVDNFIDAAENPTPGVPLDRNLDPDICLHGANDTITYSTSKAGRTIQVMKYESGNGNVGHPFVDSNAPPYPSGSPATSAKTGIMDPMRRPPHAKMKCYEFDAYILVLENGNPRCFDPHIYTDCSTSCVL